MGALDSECHPAPHPTFQHGMLASGPDNRLEKGQIPTAINNDVKAVIRVLPISIILDRQEGQDVINLTVSKLAKYFRVPGIVMQPFSLAEIFHLFL